MTATSVHPDALKSFFFFFKQELVYHCHLTFLIVSLKSSQTLRWGFVTYFFPL